MTKTWDDMRAERDRLVAAEKAKKVARMHLIHGVNEGARCGDCAHLVDQRGDYAGHFFKCGRYGRTNGPGTDWRLFWTACGLFERREAAS